MKWFMKFFFTLGALFALTSGVYAGHNGSVAFGPVSADGYTVTVCLDDVVFLEGNPGYPGAYQESNGNWMLKYDAVTFSGAKLYVLGTQELWRGGKRAALVDVSNALGSAAIDSQNVAFALRHSVPAPNYYAVLIFMVEMANGQRGWFVPYASEQLIVRNRLDEAQTLVIVSREKGQVLAPDEKGRKLAVQRE